MTIRLLSISETLRWHISARRRPVAYSIISMVRCIRFPGRINKPSYLLLIQYGRQSPLTLGERNVIGKIGPAQRLDEEKTQRRGAAFDGSGRKLALAKQIRLVLADMVRAKPFRRTVEVLRKVFHREDVRTYCALRVVATLEFIQHQLPEMGHGRPPVTHTLNRRQNYSKAHAAASVAPAT